MTAALFPVCELSIEQQWNLWHLHLSHMSERALADLHKHDAARKMKLASAFRAVGRWMLHSLLGHPSCALVEVWILQTGILQHSTLPDLSWQQIAMKFNGCDARGGCAHLGSKERTGQAECLLQAPAEVALPGKLAKAADPDSIASCLGRKALGLRAWTSSPVGTLWPELWRSAPR